MIVVGNKLRIIQRHTYRQTINDRRDIRQKEEKKNEHKSINRKYKPTIVMMVILNNIQ